MSQKISLGLSWFDHLSFCILCLGSLNRGCFTSLHSPRGNVSEILKQDTHLSVVLPSARSFSCPRTCRCCEEVPSIKILAVRWSPLGDGKQAGDNTLCTLRWTCTVGQFPYHKPKTFLTLPVMFNVVLKEFVVA